MKFYNEFWVNGKLKSEEITPISPRDRSFSLGDGLFETVKIIGKKALNWDSHMERLSHGLNFCKFNTEVSSEELLGGIAALINKTGKSDAVARIAISRGSESIGYIPKPDGVCLKTIYLRPDSGRDFNSIRSSLSSIKIYSKDPLQMIKSTSRLNYVMAALEAQNQGYDEALILNESNHIAEWASGNFFGYIEDENTLICPSADCGALPGTTAPVLIKVAESLGIKHRQVRIGLSQLPDNTTLLLTNSVKGVRAISQIDKKFFPVSPMVELMHSKLWELMKTSSLP